jgi:hypothetical protein
MPAFTIPTQIENKPIDKPIDNIIDKPLENPNINDLNFLTS